tara:strand:- start:454 stop:1104 length:651 start_codon:yes stop_codon:yes gene_type:complete
MNERMSERYYEINLKPLEKSFFKNPAEIVAPSLIGCSLVKKINKNHFLSGIIVETEAYSQIEPSCHGHYRRSTSNETLFGEPGRFYIYLTYGIYHCVNIVTDKINFASGVLLRSLAITGESERIASGPGLLAKRFDLTRKDNDCESSIESGLWIAGNSQPDNMGEIIRTSRIGISEAKELQWRWYLKKSRSISKRAPGDRIPKPENSWYPNEKTFP